MKISKQPTEVTITFSPDKYCLKECKDEMYGDYALCYLIDRSEKGKCPDIGMEVLYLDEKQADIFRKAGFSEVN